jgi:hypothetical protein
MRTGKAGLQKTDHALEYERDFEPGVHMLATATLEEDEVRFRYELTRVRRQTPSLELKKKLGDSP